MKRGLRWDPDGAAGTYALFGIAVVAYVAAFAWIASMGVQ